MVTNLRSFGPALGICVASEGSRGQIANVILGLAELPSFMCVLAKYFV